MQVALHYYSIEELANDIQNSVSKTLDSKINRDYMKNALSYHMETITEGTYVSNTKNEADQHLIGMDS